jgi:ribosomal protein L7/L12
MPVIQLELDSTGAVSSLQRFDNAADATAANTETAFSRMRSGVNKFGKAAGVAMAAASVAVLAFGMKALESAARMEETQNKYDVVFDGMTDKADEWVKELRSNYGLAEQSAKEYLSSTKAIIDGTQMETKAAGELSNQVVLLAQDLASFHDKQPEQAVKAMTSALTGEYEAMKQFGVVIKKTEVTQEAMRMNNLETKDSVTQAMEAQAAYSLILQKSGKAQGDTIRSQESYTFQLKHTQELLKDITTAIGMKLLPTATKLLKMFNTWVVEQDGVNRAINITVEIIRFFDNGIRGLILVAKGLVVLVASAFVIIAEEIRLLLTPLNLAIKGLQAMGVVNTNPLEEMVKFSHEFLNAQIEGFKETHDGIVKANTMYDSLKETVKTVGQQTVNVAAVNNKLLKPSIDKVGTSYDNIAKKATAAGDASVKAANKSKNAWEDAAAQESRVSGVGVSIGGREQRYVDGKWIGQSDSSSIDDTSNKNYTTYGSKGESLRDWLGTSQRSTRIQNNNRSSGGITVNVNQAVSRSDVTNIVSEAQRQESRL